MNILKIIRESSSSRSLVRCESLKSLTTVGSETDDSTIASLVQQRAVRFDTNVTIHVIENIFDLDKTTIWYSKSDLKSFRTEAEKAGQAIASKHKKLSKQLAIAMSKNISEEKRRVALNAWTMSKEDIRGLEDLVGSRFTKQRRRHEQRILWDAVLEAQLALMDPEGLCNISQKLTHSCTLFAQMMGEADMHAATTAEPKKSIVKVKSFVRRRLSIKKRKK